MVYRIEATRTFQDDLDKLDRKVASFVLEKTEWIAQHPEMARFPLKHMPVELKGLHKYRVGDYRIFFWMNHENARIILYRVVHRREAYQQLR